MLEQAYALIYNHGVDHFEGKSKKWWFGPNSVWGKWMRLQNVEYKEKQQKNQKWTIVALVVGVVWIVNTKWKPR